MGEAPFAGKKSEAVPDEAFFLSGQVPKGDGRFD